jgi:hypothetical protein
MTIEYIDVAIDDVFSKEGECSDSNICTFEDDFCGWINAPNDIMDDFDWLIGSDSTPSLLTGPSVDHTTGTSAGHYMYIEASDTLNKSSKAWLVSENYNPGQYSMSFWYHLYGNHMGTLNIRTRTNLDQPQLQWRLVKNLNLRENKSDWQNITCFFLYLVCKVIKVIDGV